MSEPTTQERLIEYLQGICEELETANTAALAGTDGGIHDVRVACRRLRSVLLACRKQWRPGVHYEIRSLAEDFREHGRLLSVLRDDEALGELVDEWAADAGWDTGTRDQVAEALGAGSAPAEGAVPDAAGLVKRVRKLLKHSSFAAGSRRPCHRGMLGPLRRCWGRVLERLAIAATATGSEQQTALHDLRKGVKRLRYVAEAAGEYVPGSAELVTACKTVQTTVGDMQDAAEARRRLGDDDSPAAQLARGYADRLTERAKGSIRLDLHELMLAARHVCER